MQTKYFVDAQGNYLGGFCEAEPPEGAIEVSSPPAHAADKYVNGAWVPDFSRIEKAFTDAVQAELDADAVQRGYDNILSACSYAAATNPFQAEGKLYVTRRGAAWAYCYGELAKVQNGIRAMPTIEQIISELPARVSA